MRAAQLTAAGAVIARSPATTPIRNAIAYGTPGCPNLHLQSARGSARAT